MSEADKQQRIRERAYKLWDEAGQPFGQSQDFWWQARAEIEAELLREQDKTIEQGRG